MKLGFGHSSFYMLTLEENTPFYKQYKYDQKPLPNTDNVADMYELTHTILENNYGFNHYEVSNYAKQTHSQSKHNMMYWEGD